MIYQEKTVSSSLLLTGKTPPLLETLTDLEIQEFAVLSDMLLQFQPSPISSDSGIWSISLSGTFSVSSSFHAISSRPFPPSFPCKTIWFPHFAALAVICGVNCSSLRIFVW